MLLIKEFFYFSDEEDKIEKSKISYKKLNDHIDKLSNKDKEKWFLEFEKINEIQFFPREEYRSLTNLELQFLSKHPLITLGVHTHNHYPLGNLNYEDQKQELLLSLKKLNELTINSIQYIALPHGSYNSDTLKITKELNLKVLLANDYYSSTKNKKFEKINRILMPNIEGKELIKRLKKFDF